MKTVKLTSALAVLSLVLFMSVSSIADSGHSNTGDVPKSGNKSLAFSAAAEKDFSYLRFDVNKYMNENNDADAINSSLEYLRFDVNEFISENESEAMELPVANEFEYLRFDVSSFTGISYDAINELPVNEYDYLRFDVNDYVSSSNGVIDELPVTE